MAKNVLTCPALSLSRLAVADDESRAFNGAGLLGTGLREIIIGFGAMAETSRGLTLVVVFGRVRPFLVLVLVALLQVMVVRRTGNANAHAQGHGRR
jgi:hypothetical protein